MRDMLDMTILDVRSVSIRRVAGDGQQLELIVKTKRGELVLRLIPPSRKARIAVRRQRKPRKGPSITQSRTAPGA